MESKIIVDEFGLVWNNNFSGRDFFRFNNSTILKYNKIVNSIEDSINLKKRNIEKKLIILENEERVKRYKEKFIQCCIERNSFYQTTIFDFNVDEV